MANIVVYKNHLTVVQTLIFDTIDSASSISEFLSDNLKNNFNECIKSSTDNKRNRIIEKVNSNIDKLNKREEKKVDKKLLVKINCKINSRLDECYKNKIIDNKYKNYILKLVDREKISLILSELFNEYNNICLTIKKENNRNINKSISKNVIESSRKTLENLVDQIRVKKNIVEDYKNNELDIELPKVKSKNEQSKTGVRSLTMLHDGHKYIYYNLEKVGTNKYKFDIDSFSAEEDLYLKALVENRTEVFSEMMYFDNDVILSPFEKRRMQFIQNMYDMERGLDVLKIKKVDVTTNVDTFYKFAKSIVDNFYLQLMSEDSDINALNTLMYFTRLSYGANRQFENYRKASNSFLDKYSKVPSYVTKELLINSYSIKSKVDYNEFRRIQNIIPTDEDIIVVLNRRLSTELSDNIMKYISDISFYIDRVVTYMKIDDIVDMYLNIRNSLNRFGLRNPSVNEKDFIKLQRKICEVICRKLCIGYNSINDYAKELYRICNNLLKEKPIFVVDRYEVLSEDYKQKLKIEEEYRKIAYKKYINDISLWNNDNSLSKFINSYSNK